MIEGAPQFFCSDVSHYGCERLYHKSFAINHMHGLFACRFRCFEYAFRYPPAWCSARKGFALLSASTTLDSWTSSLQLSIDRGSSAA